MDIQSPIKFPSSEFFVHFSAHNSISAVVNYVTSYLTSIHKIDDQKVLEKDMCATNFLLDFINHSD